MFFVVRQWYFFKKLRCCSLEDELTCRRDRVAVKKRMNRPNRYDHHVFVDEITDNDPRIVFAGMMFVFAEISLKIR